MLEIVKYNKINGYILTAELFESLETSNFEDVLRAIYYSYIVNKGFRIGDFNLTSIMKLYNDVKKSLIDSVKITHVKYQDVCSVIDDISNKLSAYKTIFTTNYDLIIYWSIMSDADKYRDFFWNNNRFDVFNTKLYEVNSIPVYYLHGAIHLREDGHGNIHKVNPSNLLNDIYDTNTDFPLFVSEGKSDIKMNKIRTNLYLNFCYDNFSCLKGNLVVFGHSLNLDYDGHIINAINKSNLETVAIGVFSGLSKIEKDYCMTSVLKSFGHTNKKIIYFE